MGRTWLLIEHGRWHKTAGIRELKQTGNIEGLVSDTTTASVATRGAAV